MGDGKGKSPQRFEIRAGAPVMGLDGEIGRVDRLVINPGRGEVTGLIVRKGLFLRRDVVIPFDAVQDANEEQVLVGLTANEVDGLPEFREQDYIAPPSDWHAPSGQPADTLLFRVPEAPARSGQPAVQAGQTEASVGGRPIKVGQKVVSRDGEVGKLDLVLLDPTTRKATHFVVRRGGLLGKDTIVPVAWVREITRDRIYLDVGRKQLDRLPPYRPDDEILGDVLDALWDLTDLPPAELQFVEVDVRDGIVALHGHTLTREGKALVEAVVREVPGVMGVRNRLQTFEEMVASLHEAQHAKGEPISATSRGK